MSIIHKIELAGNKHGVKASNVILHVVFPVPAWSLRKI